jgi:hypothetical protein
MLNGEDVEIEANPVANVDVQIAIGSMALPNSLQEQEKARMLMEVASQYGSVPAMELPTLVRFALVENLKALGYNDVNTILGIKDEEELKKEQEDAMATQAKQQEAQLIDQENMAMIAGENPPVTANQDHATHRQSHTKFKVMQEEMKGIDENQKKAFMEHDLQHIQYEEQQNKPTNYTQLYEEAKTRESKGTGQARLSSDTRQGLQSTVQEGEGLSGDSGAEEQVQ